MSDNLLLTVIQILLWIQEIAGMYLAMPEAALKPENLNPICDSETRKVLILVAVPKRLILRLALRWLLRACPQGLGEVG